MICLPPMRIHIPYMPIAPPPSPFNFFSMSLLVISNSPESTFVPAYIYVVIERIYPIRTSGGDM